MKYSEYTNLICTMLGAPIVEVEVRDEIKNYVDIAFLEIKPSISTTKYITIPNNKVIDLSDKDIYSIVSIFRGDTNGLAVGNITDESLLFGNSVIASGGFIEDFTNLRMNLMVKQLTNTITPTSDIDFVYKKPLLYVEMSGNASQNITLEYIPDFTCAEEVEDPYWTNLLFRLALAHTKIALGRARGKFRVSSVPYELDADNLINEGTQELSEIRTKLEDSTDLFYPLD